MAAPAGVGQARALQRGGRAGGGRDRRGGDTQSPPSAAHECGPEAVLVRRDQHGHAAGDPRRRAGRPAACCRWRRSSTSRCCFRTRHRNGSRWRAVSGVRATCSVSSRRHATRASRAARSPTCSGCWSSLPLSAFTTVRRRGHSERVRVFADLIAEEMKLSPHDRARLRWASLLHDIGKLLGSQRDAHQAVVSECPRMGARPPSSRGGRATDRAAAGVARRVVGCRRTAPREVGWQGIPSRSGRGEDLARRPHRGCRRLVRGDDGGAPVSATDRGRFAAREELVRCSGKQFDPAVVRAFLNISVGRLWRVVGVGSWIAQVPFVSWVNGLGLQWGTAFVSGSTALGLAVPGMLPGHNALPRPDPGPSAVSVIDASGSLPWRAWWRRWQLSGHGIVVNRRRAGVPGQPTPRQHLIPCSPARPPRLHRRRPASPTPGRARLRPRVRLPTQRCRCRQGPRRSRRPRTAQAVRSPIPAAAVGSRGSTTATDRVMHSLALSGLTFSLQHAYAEVCTCTVTVTVANIQGGSGSGSTGVTVVSAPPVVSVAPEGSPSSDTSSAAAASRTLTPVLTVSRDGELRRWHGTHTAGPQWEAISPCRTHMPRLLRTYTVTVTITDDDGAAAHATTTVTAVL